VFGAGLLEGGLHDLGCHLLPRTRAQRLHSSHIPKVMRFPSGPPIPVVVVVLALEVVIGG